jgi:dienelactone hydrolase
MPSIESIYLRGGFVKNVVGSRRCSKPLGLSVHFVLAASALCFVFWCSRPLLAQSDPPAAPWDMQRLNQAPKWQVLERPKADRVKPISYDGLPWRGKATRVFAWLGIPDIKPGEKVPAMVLIHGGGGTAFEEWVRLWMDRGYAAIAMDTCGQVPVGNYGRWLHDEQGGPAGWGGFDQLEWPREDQWTFHAVADAILAHSLIRSLPEVDSERTGVTGISWGGYLTCIVAGMDSRFKLAVPVYGCGFYRDTLFATNLASLSPEQAARWMEWWDPSVYLRNAEMPFLWVTGSNDFAYPLGALQRSYRLPKGPRSLCIRLRMPHGHGGAGENPREIHVFADSILKHGAGLPAVINSGREGASVWVAYESKAPVKQIVLNYTRDTGRWQDRQWETTPASQNGARFTAKLPEGTHVYYFNLFDERNCVVSTEHVEL